MKELGLIKKTKLNRVTLLSAFLSILVVSKIALGFIPGFEIVTYLFIIIGLYISSKELLSLVFSFWLITNIVYGFNIVFVPYLWIFFIVGTLSKVIFKVFRSKYIWAMIMMVSPILLTVSYFFYDWFIFDYAYASTRILTAIPTFLLASISTGFMLMIATPYMLKIFNRYLKKDIDIEFGTGIKQIPLVLSSSSLAIFAVWGTYRIQNHIYSIIADISLEDETELCDPDNPSYHPDEASEGRLFNVEEFCQKMESMGENDILIRLLINAENIDDTYPAVGDITSFEIIVEDVASTSERIYLSDVLMDIGSKDDKWEFYLKWSESLGYSFRNFSYEGKWYGESNWCGFSYVNDNRAGTGVSGTILRKKAIYTFDYHGTSPSYTGYCRHPEG